MEAAIKEDKRLYKIDFSDIHYAQAYGDYVKIITSDKVYLTKETLSNFQKQLPEEFIQIHRSYLINLGHLKYIEGNHVVIYRDKIPVSNSYKEQLLNRL